MIVLAGSIGLIAGWLITLLSDALPHRMQVPGAAFALHQPALWAVMVSGRAFPHRTLHLIAEILMSGCMMFLTSRYPGLPGAVQSAICAFLLLVALIDIKYRRILNITMYPAVLLVLLAGMIGIQPNLSSRLMGGGLAFGLFWLASVVSPGGLGGGDIKLAALLGCFFGLPGILWVLLAGTGAGAVAAVAMLAGRQATRLTRIPYAPFLCLGAWVVLLFTPV